jgi:multidrug efflux system outer membrane protein
MSERTTKSMRRPGVAGVALAAALASAGCSSLIPAYERPAAPVPGTYPVETTPAASPSALPAAELDWQRFFADERLKRLIGLALANNRDLRIAALNIEQARALYDIRRADQWPTIGVGGTAARQAVGNGIGTVYSVGIAASSYELDVFGRIRALSESALDQYLATAETRKAVQIGLVGSVATTYLALLADDEQIDVTRQTLATREESTRLTRLRFENGASSELDFRQSESLLEGARATLAQTLRQRSLDENALQLLVGQPIPADLPPGLPLGDVQLGTDVPPGLPSDLLVRRPDIRAAEQQLLAANANIGAARAAFFPRISLTGTFGTASSELSGLFKGGSWAFTGTGQLLQPLFDAGRNRANLASARVGRDIAVAQYERSIQSAFREVADALAGRATLGEQVRAQAAQVNALSITYRLADLRYRAGASSYLDALDAQRQLFAAQQALVQVRAASLQNSVTLYRVLGGGWKDEPSTPVVPASSG